MVSWFTAVYVLVVYVCRFYIQSLDRLVYNYLFFGPEGKDEMNLILLHHSVKTLFNIILLCGMLPAAAFHTVFHSHFMAKCLIAFIPLYTALKRT
jgi:hypothetical protein